MKSYFDEACTLKFENTNLCLSYWEFCWNLNPEIKKHLSFGRRLLLHY